MKKQQEDGDWQVEPFCPQHEQKEQKEQKERREQKEPKDQEQNLNRQNPQRNLRYRPDEKGAGYSSRETRHH